MTVRLGFVGTGQMGQAAHLQNFVRLPECDVVALAEPRQELRERVARRHGIPRTYASAREMLDAEDLDGIVAIQPFDRHAQILPELYESGLPLLSEKPLAIDDATGEGLLARLGDRAHRHMVAYHKRCDLASEHARRRVAELRASDEVGPVRYLRVTMPPGDWIQGGFADIVRTDETPPASDPDAVVDDALLQFVNYYIHQVNLIRFLLDESFEVVHASASGHLLVGLSESGVDVVLEMAPWHDASTWEESVLVGFERGWLRLDLPAPLATMKAGTVTEHRDAGDGASALHRTFANEHAMLSQARRFVALVRGDATAPTDATDALIDLRIAAAYVAATEARRVR